MDSKLKIWNMNYQKKLLELIKLINDSGCNISLVCE